MRLAALVIFGTPYVLLAIGRLRPFRLDRTGIAIGRHDPHRYPAVR
jgi:hypothetical protein